MILNTKLVSRPGVNFTNILRAAFTLVGPKSAKWHCWLDCIFAHSGSTCIKAVRRMLMKLSPGVNFINIQWAAFTLEEPKSVKKSSCQSFLRFWDLHVQKLLVNMLVKLTTVCSQGVKLTTVCSQGPRTSGVASLCYGIVTMLF